MEENYKELIRNTELVKVREEASEKKAIDIVNNLKKAGISIDIIAKSSGLSVKEIENLS